MATEFDADNIVEEPGGELVSTEPAAVETAAAGTAAAETADVEALDVDAEFVDAPEADVAEAAEEGSAGKEAKESFSALKDQLSQGRVLKQHRRALDALEGETASDRETYEDQLDILARFEEIVAEQQGIIDQAEADLAANESEAERVSASVEDYRKRLLTMKDGHEATLKGLKAQLDARRDELARAERAHKEAVKNEAPATEVDARAAELQSAKAANDTAKRAYKTTKKDFEREEKPLESFLSDQRKYIEQLEKQAEALQERKEQALERIAYCEQVHDNPAQVDELKSKINASEAQADAMTEHIGRLADEHAKSSSAATPAKIIVALAVVVIICVLIAWLTLR